MFCEAPQLDFRSQHSHCPSCLHVLNVRKTQSRTVSTLHIGRFTAKETILICPQCHRIYGSEELAQLVPAGANFGYDVLVYVGKALFLRSRNEEEVVADLAERNIRISPSEVSVLGRKFIVYLALAHERCAPKIKEGMDRRGGYILHLDATCEGGSPMLMSSIDSLSEIVLGNVKIPSESEEQIVPFLERFKETFGIPLALVHDMGSGILRSVAKVFPNVPDFICHFHFLRDIGKDLLGEDYDLIRQRLRKHEIHAKLRSQAKAFKRRLEPSVMDILSDCLPDRLPSDTDLALFPLVSAYSLSLWTLEGRTQGKGYGFPFDQPHLAFAKRIQHLYRQLSQIREFPLLQNGRDYMPCFDLLNSMNAIIDDRHLWPAVENIEGNIVIFERLRQALRIAPKAGFRGLNDEGAGDSIQSIEQRVTTFRDWLTNHHDYPQNQKARNLITQLDKYWVKLFANPITVQLPSGTITIQPQRTNNLLEQFFRYLKRAHRRRTGNASSSGMLRGMLAETPLVKNLQNQAYLPTLLNGKASIEEVFAEIDIAAVRQQLRKVQPNLDQIPPKIEHAIATTDYPDKLLSTLKKAAL